MFSAVERFCSGPVSCRTADPLAVSGQKYKIKGYCLRKMMHNTFIVRDAVGVDTRVVVAAECQRQEQGGFWGGDKYPVNSLSFAD